MDQKPQKRGRFRGKIINFMQENARDAYLLVGFLMVFYGLWHIYHPAAWIVCGIAVFWVGLPPLKRRRE